MIPFFPRIYEDELFYSVLARYHRYSGNVKSIKTMRDLYGENIIRVYSHIDRKLKRLHEQVKIFDIPILEELIAKHTFYFYYTNFKGEEIKRRLKEVILNGEECGVVRLIGMKYNRYFKYCSHCIREDIEKYGETYWHLQHQIFGVHVCLKHNTILCNSDVYWNNYSKKRSLFEIQGATLENCPVDRKSAVFCKNTKQKLVIIAKELLKVSRGDCDINPDDLSRIYRYLLFKKGYMKGKFVNSKKFYHDFIKYYGEEVLELLNLNFDSNKRTNWVISIVKKGRRVFSPLQHILIIVFLGEKINTISQYRSLEESLFGEGPYPCLNPFTKHYLEYKIDTFELKLNQGNHIGVFTCNCGFTFSCLLKDYNEKKQFSIHQIIGMNKECNNYFELLMSGGLKQETLYHLDKEVIMLLQKKYLLYRQGKKRMLSCKPSSEKLEQYRKQWLEYRENYSNFSVDKLRALAGGVYIFLYRHDREWLYENTIYKKRSIPQINNWIEVDKNLLVDVQGAIRKIKNDHEYPIRVTKHSIGRELSRSLGEYTLKNCPLTAEFLMLNVESVEQFQIRRIYWAIEKLISKNEPVLKSKVKKLARLSDNISKKASDELSKIIDNNF